MSTFELRCIGQEKGIVVHCKGMFTYGANVSFSWASVKIDGTVILTFDKMPTITENTKEEIVALGEPAL